METPTRYDLNAAIENWLAELAAQPNLTTEVRRELETHLRDAIAGFQQRGLSDEESFWLARRRVGQPQPLAEEFVKVDPAAVWRERVFWIMLGLLVLRFWNILCSSFLSPLFFHASLSHLLRFEDIFPQWVRYYLPGWIRDSAYTPALFIVIGLANSILALLAVYFITHGKLHKIRLAMDFIFTNRVRFILLTVLFATLLAMAGNFIWNSLSEPQLHGRFLSVMFLNNFLGLLLPASIAAWLAPTQNRKTPKHA